MKKLLYSVPQMFVSLLGDFLYSLLLAWVLKVFVNSLLHVFLTKIPLSVAVTYGGHILNVKGDAGANLQIGFDHAWCILVVSSLIFRGEVIPQLPLSETEVTVEDAAATETSK